MESLLGSVGYWLGINFVPLLQAGGVALLTGVLTRAVSRTSSGRSLHAAAIAFFAVFGFQSLRATSGWVYLMTEDRALATVAELTVGAVALVGLVLVIVLRRSPRVAAAAGVFIVLCLGASIPIADATIQSRQSALESASSATASIPAAYPPVALWSNEEDRFGAMFPSEPTRVGAASTQGGAHAHQSQFMFPDGAAMASVTISPLPFALDPESQRPFLVDAHRSFLRSINAQIDSSLSHWDTLANGIPILKYEALFAHQGVPLIGKGYWVADRRRAIRVSVAYPRALSQSSAAVADYFPNTFILMGDRTPTGGARQP